MRIAQVLTTATLFAAAATSSIGHAACSAEETQEWISARKRYLGSSGLVDFDALLQKRVELCIAVANGHMTQQLADQKFEQARRAVLHKWGKSSDTDAY